MKRGARRTKQRLEALRILWVRSRNEHVLPGDVFETSLTKDELAVLLEKGAVVLAEPEEIEVEVTDGAN